MNFYDIDNILNSTTTLTESIDNMLVILEKPYEYMTNKPIKFYHGSSQNLKKLEPTSINVGATKFSQPRWSVYLWDNEDSAISWSIYRLCDKHNVNKCLKGKYIYYGNDNKVYMTQDVLDSIRYDKTFVYSTVCNIRDIAVGSSSLIKEYTIDRTLDIDSVKTISITNDIINKHCIIVNIDDIQNITNGIMDNISNKYSCRNRNMLMRIVLDPSRDTKRKYIKRDLKDGLLLVGDDLSNYSKLINESFILLLEEDSEKDTKEEKNKDESSDDSLSTSDDVTDTDFNMDDEEDPTDTTDTDSPEDPTDETDTDTDPTTDGVSDETTTGDDTDTSMGDTTTEEDTSADEPKPGEKTKKINLINGYETLYNALSEQIASFSMISVTSEEENEYIKDVITKLTNIKKCLFDYITIELRNNTYEKNLYTFYSFKDIIKINIKIVEKIIDLRKNN